MIGFPVSTGLEIDLEIIQLNKTQYESNCYCRSLKRFQVAARSDIRTSEIGRKGTMTFLGPGRTVLP